MKKKLKDVCNIEKGKQIDTKSLDDSNSYRYINGGIKESGFYNDFNTSGEAVLISEGGASCGYVNYVNERFWCGCHCYRLTDIKVYPKFLFYSLKASQNGIMELRTGAAMPNIKKESLKNFEVSIIEDKEEQIKIAAHLDKIQSAIDNKKRQLSLLDEAVKSKFVEMFGENPVESGKWKVEELGKICSKISDGVHAKPEYQEDGMPFISVVNMNTGNLSFEDCKFVSFEAYEKMIKSTNPEKGDVLYTKVGATYGISALVDTDRKFCLYVSVALLKPMHDLIDSVFLTKTMMMPYVKHQADNSLKGIGVPDLHLNQIRSFKIAVPPLSLQNNFAAFVQQINKSKFVVQKSLEKAETLYKSLMQEYFG